MNDVDDMNDVNDVNDVSPHEAPRPASVTSPATGHGALTDRCFSKLRPKRRKLPASVRRSVCAVMVCENCPRVRDLH